MRSLDGFASLYQPAVLASFQPISERTASFEKQSGLLWFEARIVGRNALRVGVLHPKGPRFFKVLAKGPQIVLAWNSFLLTQRIDLFFDLVDCTFAQIGPAITDSFALFGGVKAAGIGPLG